METEQNDARTLADFRIKDAARLAAADEIKAALGNPETVRDQLYRLRELTPDMMDKLREAVRWYEEQKSREEDRGKERTKSIYLALTSLAVAALTGIGAGLAATFGFHK